MKQALIVIDVQNDFCPGGALAVERGDSIVETLNRYSERFAAAGHPVIFSRDWHPAETSHFASRGGIWPSHCVQNTSGAAFHPSLKLPEGAKVVSKGSGDAEDAYSAFQGRDESGRLLAELLHHGDVDSVFVGGLATDYCVRATVLDALRAGLRATLLIDASRAVNIKPGDAEEAIAEMVRAGADIATIERLELSPSIMSAQTIKSAKSATKVS